MHKGVFIGSNAKKQGKRVLILGESHHTSSDADGLNCTPGVEATYETEEVVREYLENYHTCSGKDRKASFRFFDNIVLSFGVDPESGRVDFWSKVYFGNYIDVLCGVRDSKATNLLKKAGKREELNKQLFEFIEENEIDIVFCFSRKVYDKLPSLDEKLGDAEIKGDASDLHRLNKCVYCPGPAEREFVSISLSKTVTVYGLKHPSQGFSYRQYQNRIVEIMKESRLSFLAGDVV